MIEIREDLFSHILVSGFTRRLFEQVGLLSGYLPIVSGWLGGD